MTKIKKTREASSVGLVRCEHGVYDPHGDQKYCTVCNPVLIQKSEVFGIEETSVGKLAAFEMPTSKKESKRWESTLKKEHLGIRQLGLQEDIAEAEDSDMPTQIIEGGPEIARKKSGGNEDFRQIMEVIDGDDIFLTGHQVKKIRTREKDTPAWAIDNKETQKLLLRAFPKLETNARQRKLAGRWAFVVHLFYRMGMTRSQIAAEMRTNTNIIHHILQRIRKIADGVTGARGRPKKLTAPSKPSL